MRKTVRSGGIERGGYRYQWGIANRLLSKENEITGAVTRYDYDQFDFLIRQETTQGSETDVIYRVPDFIGNLFETPDKKDRKYSAGGKLVEDPEYFYHYDDEGNLIFREFKQLPKEVVLFNRKQTEKELGIKLLGSGMGWRYEWYSNGMLREVIRPDKKTVRFRYDALGRRTAKSFRGEVTRWVWDGNVPLHEWKYSIRNQEDSEEKVIKPVGDAITWVFEEGTFIPTAKIQGDKQYSIVSDYLGTPIQMYDEQGNKTWDCILDIYGKVLTFDGCSLNDCPFRFQGQYEDEETELYYNKFRYYSTQIGNYISQDPIKFEGNNPTIYGYVYNTNCWCDVFGLAIIPIKTYGNNGELLTATTTIQRRDLNTGTATNASSRSWAKQNGLPTDDAGHIIGRQLGGSGGIQNVFPQDFHRNRGEFAQFEGTVADFVNLHGDAKITVEFEYDLNVSKTRPTSVIYSVEASNGAKMRARKFSNSH